MTRLLELTFSVMAASYDDAVDKIVAALEVAGAENLRRDFGFEKPKLLRVRRAK